MLDKKTLHLTQKFPEDFVSLSPNVSISYFF